MSQRSLPTLAPALSDNRSQSFVDLQVINPDLSNSVDIMNLKEEMIVANSSRLLRIEQVEDEEDEIHRA